MTSRVSSEHRYLIIEHWFRMLYGSKISVQDIANVIIEFGDLYEQLMAWTDPKYFEISEDSLTVTFKNEASFILVCGQIDAVKGE